MLYAFKLGKHKHFLRAGGPDVLRVLAHPSQDELLHTYKTRPVEIVSLNHFNSRRTSDADYMLNRMTTLEKVSLSNGGFRPLKDAEYHALKLGNENPDLLLTGKCDVSSLKYHPFLLAGGAFVFNDYIPTGAIQLLMYCYDIRRFRHTSHNRSNIQKFFKLTTSAPLYRVLEAKAVETETVRPGMVFNAWYDHILKATDFSALLSSPSAYFFRYYDQVKKKLAETSGDGISTARHALWDTTSHYLNFVESVWLAGSGGPAFEAEKFFVDQDTAAAFNDYIKQVNKKFDNSSGGT